MVVVDTNVVVAGLLTHNPDAPTARLLSAMLEGRVRFVVSLPLLAEYQRVLLRPAIASLHRLAPAEIEEVLTEITTNAVVLDAPRSASAAPDPGDQHLVDLLAASPSLRLVTGDRRLLESLSSGRVLTPAQYCNNSQL